MARSWTRWPVPLFRAGSVDIHNLMGTDDSPDQGESKWKFELRMSFQGEDITPGTKTQTFNISDGKSSETLSVKACEDGAVEVSYEGHLVSADDVQDINWSSRLIPYDGNPSTMPYIGMWQSHDEKRTEKSALQDRIKREQEWTAMKERFWGVIALIVFLLVASGLVVLAFQM